MKPHPCLSCGACCAYFRVSFYWAEAVPENFTQKLNAHRAVMKGTDHTHAPRCIALLGTIGKQVECQIYDDRPSPCRTFQASFENGEHHLGCDQARIKQGLKPLEPQDYLD